MDQNSDRTIESMDDLEISVFLLYRTMRSEGGPSRDRLPYTEEFKRLRNAFNREKNLNYSLHVFWIHLDLTLKAGEKNIKPYLQSRHIQFN